MIEKYWSEDPKKRSIIEELFKKLSLSNEDFFLEFEWNYEELKIVSEEEKVESEDESGVSKMYYPELRQQIEKMNQTIIKKKADLISWLKTEISNCEEGERRPYINN